MLSNPLRSGHVRVYSVAVIILSVAPSYVITSTDSTVIAGFAGLAAGWFGGRLWGSLAYGNTTTTANTEVED